MGTPPPPDCTVLLASDNANKLAWVRSAFADSWLQIEPAPTSIYLPVEEDGDSCQDNARAKARAVRTSGPVLAEDSGLFVAALDGRPGTHTARWSPSTDAERARRIHHLLRDATDRTATFASAIAIRLPLGHETIVTGTVTGTIARHLPPAVSGYHDIFISDLRPFPPNDAIPPAPHRRQALARARTTLEKHLPAPDVT